ncbi:hypothetical protein [Paractinoplanes durhamensis]|uniref:hypothetical protein n=1 Tax=Paractinoplanes durhamensis TaxID=113563 RepID=UPI0036449CE3
MAAILARIGAFCARRRWWVLGAWVVVLVLAVGLSMRFAEPLDTELTVSGLQSTETLDQVDREFGSGGDTGRVVFAAPPGQTLAAYRPALTALGTALGAEPTLSPPAGSATSPWPPHRPRHSTRPAPPGSRWRSRPSWLRRRTRAVPPGSAC